MSQTETTGKPKQMPHPPEKIEGTIHELLDRGVTSVPAIAGRVVSIYGNEAEGIDTLQNLIASINQAKQTYEESGR